MDRLRRISPGRIMRPKKVSDVHDLNSRKKPRLNTQPLPSPIRTCGKVFSNGATIELFQGTGAGGPLRLHFFDGKRATIAPQVQFNGRLYRPAEFSSSIRRVVKFPQECMPFGSTTRLFAAIQQLFTSHGFLEAVAAAATYFIFATWFIGASPIAPALFITGSRLEASLLLQLLGCLVRRPLPLAEVTRHGLCSLPMKLLPTLLISADQIRPAAMGLLRTSSRRNAFFPLRDGLVDFFCAKAVYSGDIADNDFLGEGALHVNVAPFRGPLPLLEEEYAKEVTKKFQSQLLAYRCRYILDVRESKFDVPELTPGTRMLARVFGAPIVDASALQAGLTRLLQDHEENKLELLWTDLRCVVLEAALHHCHKEPGERVQVGSITKTVNAILKGRGEAKEREAREIGFHLKGLGLIAKRKGPGWGILLDSAVCRHIHGLAHGFGLLAMRKGEARCQQCHSTVNGIKARNGRASESEKKHA